MVLFRCLVLGLFICLFGGELRAQETFQSKNFVVTAPTREIAKDMAKAAETARKEQAKRWLGKEMPAWAEPCELEVKVSLGGAGGVTSFAFDHGKILSQRMRIEGVIEALPSVLAHEVTHTVFAHYLGRPVPRWADEGAAILSEDRKECLRHDRLCRDILNTPTRAVPLRRLFEMQQYPSDILVLYAEGYSVTRFLVERKDHRTFLAFVKAGQAKGWDKALKAHYQFDTVEDMEEAWRLLLRGRSKVETNVDLVEAKR
jgi:hypothetical protein